MAVLALPSVFGVGALLSGAGRPPAAAPAAPAVAAPAAVAALGSGLAPVAAPSPSALPTPAHTSAPQRPPSSVIARSGVRIARAARVAAAQVKAPRLVTQVVGLGDSVPAGTNCDCTDYVHLLAADLGHDQGSDVTGTDLAVPGLSTGALLDQLATPDVRQAVAAADVVVVTVGANDLETGSDPSTCTTGQSSSGGPDADRAAVACYRDEFAALSPNLDRIAAELAALPTSPGARVLVTGYWNVFLDGAAARSKGPGYAQVADAVTAEVNRRISAAAAAHGATYVDLFTAFRGSDGSRDCTSLLAADGDHPNAAGHALIEKSLAAAL